MVENESKPMTRSAIRGLSDGTWVKVTWSDAPPEWVIFLGLEPSSPRLPRVLCFRKNPRRKRADAQMMVVNFDQIVDHAPLTVPTH